MIDVGSISDREVARKILLMFSTFSIGILMLFVLGSVSLYRHEFLMGTLDYSVALILIALLLFLRKSSYRFCCYSGLFLMTLLFWYFFMSGAGVKHAFLWLYTYPLFVFFLLGAHRGALVIELFSLPCLVFLFFDLYSGNNNLYDQHFAIRFIPSFLTVSLFAFMFEKSGEDARKFLTEAQSALEQQVLERTAELQNEVNAREKNEKKLKNSEQQYRTLFDSNDDGVSIIGTAGRFLKVNEELCHCLGYEYKELLHMTPQEINSPVSVGLVSPYLQDLFGQRKDSVVLEVEHVRRDGKIIPVELRAKKIFFNNKDAVLSVYRDIRDRKKEESERMRLEAQLHRSQKMEIIGQMAGGVAHDLNNILAGVVTYPDLLLQQLPENHHLCEPLKIIKESGERASAVVADLLTVARGVARLKETANLNISIREYLCSPEHQILLSHHPEIKFVTELAPDLMNIDCSVVHVKKCLMNLLFNAAEAIQGPGTVSVSTCNRDVDAENAASLHLVPGQNAVMVVSDTGTGINNIDRHRIFEPFYTKKKLGRSGTGLGLAIVWNTMQDHKGTVTVESNSKGSSFTLYFPVSKGQISERGGLSVDLEILKGQGENILVVDDDALQRDISVKMLRLLDYTASAVASGEEAVASLENGAVDLILMDMLMEPGMNGCQTYAEVIKRYPGQKAIIVSGYSENEDVVKAYQLGAEGFIKKPYTVTQLGRTVQEILKT